MSDYASDLVRARAKLEELLRLRDEADLAVARQQRRVAALAELAGESESSDSDDLDIEGLTDAVSSVLKAAAPGGLDTKDIRTKLIQLYFPVTEYKNFRASLHTTLKRLIKSGNVVRKEAGEDATRYFWESQLRFSSHLKGRFAGGRFQSRFDRKR
jgi:hypothetical protein